MGGLSWDDDERRRLQDYFLGAAGRERPRVLFVPTATGDSAEATLMAYTQLSEQADVSHLLFHPWPPSGLREYTLDQDVIFISGGNTANALAIWRAHGFDKILREAWEAGIVLAGWSAGHDLLVRGRGDRLVRPAARGDARRPRVPPRERVPALRRRGHAAPGLHAARRRGASRPGSPRTTRLPCATTAPSWPRSWPPGRQLAPTASRPRVRNRSRPECSSERTSLRPPRRGGARRRRRSRARPSG